MTLPWNSCRFDQNAAHTVGGGAPFGCSGTAITIASPNDLSTGAAWTNTGQTGTPNAALAPDGVSMTATLLASTATSAFGTLVFQAIASPTGGVLMKTGGFIKPVSGPTWMLIQAQDSSTFDQFGSWFNFAGPNGTAGSPSEFGTGSLSCNQIRASTNGYYEYSFAGEFSATPTHQVRFQLFMVDGDGTGVPSIPQTFNAWGIGT